MIDLSKRLDIGIANIYFSIELGEIRPFGDVIYTDKDKKINCFKCNKITKPVLSHSFSKSWFLRCGAMKNIIYSKYFNHNFIISCTPECFDNKDYDFDLDNFIVELYIDNCNKNDKSNMIYREHKKKYLNKYKDFLISYNQRDILRNNFVNNADITNSLVFSNFYLLCEDCENEYSHGGLNENSDFSKNAQITKTIIEKNIDRILNFYKYNINIRKINHLKNIKMKEMEILFCKNNQKTLFAKINLFNSLNNNYIIKNNNYNPFYSLIFKSVKKSNQNNFINSIFKRNNTFLYNIDKYYNMQPDNIHPHLFKKEEIISNVFENFNKIEFLPNELMDNNLKNIQYLESSISKLNKQCDLLDEIYNDYLLALQNHDKATSFKELKISEQFTYFGFSFFNPLISFPNNLQDVFEFDSDFEKCPIFILSIPKYEKIYIFSSEKNINILNNFIEHKSKIGFSIEQIITYFLSAEINAIGSYNKQNILKLIQLNKMISSDYNFSLLSHNEQYIKTIDFISRMDLLDNKAI